MEQQNNFAESFTKKTFSDNLHHIAQLIKLLQNNDLKQSHLVLKDCLLISNARMLEGISNTLITAMPISDRLKKDLVEKFQVLGKFDLAMFIGAQKSLDYSNDLIGNIINIMSARNNHVHPKVSDSKFNSLDVDSESGQVFFELTPKKAIDIMLSTSKMFQFLDAFFIDWCKCEGLYISGLLCESVKFVDGNVSILQNLNLIEDKKIIEDVLKIEIKFLALIVQERMNIQHNDISDNLPQKQ